MSHQKFIMLTLASSLIFSPSVLAKDTKAALTTAPSATHQITDAPGRGIKPGLSEHSAATPLLYKLDQQPLEFVSPDISRQYINGAQSTFAKWTAKAGSKVPLHHHANEQITWIVSGSANVFSGGKMYHMKAGDIMIIPANVPHEFEFLEDSIDIDIFAPQRQDWIDGTAAYLPK